MSVEEKRDRTQTPTDLRGTSEARRDGTGGGRLSWFSRGDSRPNPAAAAARVDNKRCRIGGLPGRAAELPPLPIVEVVDGCADGCRPVANGFLMNGDGTSSSYAAVLKGGVGMLFGTAGALLLLLLP